MTRTRNNFTQRFLTLYSRSFLIPAALALATTLPAIAQSPEIEPEAPSNRLPRRTNDPPV